jgi:hypothetical protein
MSSEGVMEAFTATTFGLSLLKIAAYETLKDVPVLPAVLLGLQV